MGKGYFITGTNTDVGKTIVTRALARLLANRGIDVAAIKPVESGVDHANQTHCDAARLIRAAKRNDTVKSVCAYQFIRPISPHLAAQKEGVTIEGSTIVQFMNEWLKQAQIVLAEGAGGLLVPLGSSFTYGDVTQKTPFELIIVAPNVLGTINSTLLTIESARSRGIPIAGVILNRTPKKDWGNRDAIAHCGQVPILGEVPDLPDEDDRMAEILGHHLDTKTLHF